MLWIPDLPLPNSAEAQLAAYQADVDSAGSYEDRVAEAKRLFSLRNKKNNPAFKTVRDTLDRMCSGARRCMYCEDSVADEVEHFKPKDFYPEQVFSWANYLYACGSCNRGKSSKFPVVSDLSGQIIHLTRAQGEPILPPEAGTAALLDLRQEDPLEYLRLDLQDTFYFEPVSSDETSLDHRRARIAIEILGLNARDYLCRARAEAFDSYLARLDQYVLWRDAGVGQATLDRLERSLRRMGHPTVWIEIKRQRDQFPALRRLFEQAPETLEW
jgi:uncharacterized protein (TIGR02646 family)